MTVKGTNFQKTAMAKTVGLPLAMCVMLVLENKIELGLQLPLQSIFYETILSELQKNGIEFV